MPEYYLLLVFFLLLPFRLLELLSLFFFQAEDGIRDRNVTGVQTCALPIYRPCAVRDAPVQRPLAGQLPQSAGSFQVWIHNKQRLTSCLSAYKLKPMDTVAK